MKVLIIGASGMLGHQLWLELGKFHDVYGTLRRKDQKLENLIGNSHKLLHNINVENLQVIKEIIDNHQFDVIINCVGVVKQLDASKEHIPSIAINSLFPHQLASVSGNAKLIQISTDCVFSGSKGRYQEEDFADADDLYGRSKFLGEVTYGNHLTLRTSIVGHELNSCRSLFDWFLSTKGEVKGFSKAIYSGLTTLELSKQIHLILTNHFDLSGLWQISSKPIDKFTLLNKVAKVYGKDVVFRKDEEFVTDKSLSFEKIKSVGYQPTDWEVMIDELHTHYRAFKGKLY